MKADCKGALAQLNKSWKAFTHNDKPMTKMQVKAVLEYAVKKGYEHTGLLSAKEVDNIIASVENVQENLIFNEVPLNWYDWTCDLCGSDDVTESPAQGRNCNSCNPL